MNQLSFTETRSRRADPQTSRDAARNAASTKAQDERRAIKEALDGFAPGLTAKELSETTGIEFHALSRRISEVAGIGRTGERRGGCAVWASFSR